MRLHLAVAAFIPVLACGGYAAKDSCFECHSVMEGMSIVFKDDVHFHNAISCADCHGGDPKEDDQNLSMSAERGFKVRVTRQATPDYCGRCHSDAAFMRKHKPQQRADQPALYRTSVHARRLAASSTGGAGCVDCHSVHNIRAVSDPLSPANPRLLTQTCGKCHRATADLFEESPHGRTVIGRSMAGCTACHASHAVEPAGSSMLTGKNAVCARCHAAGSAGARAAAEIARVIAALEAAASGPNESLARARVAIHSFDAAAVKRAAERAPAGRK